jgi:hypothetical protein
MGSQAAWIPPAALPWAQPHDDHRVCSVFARLPGTRRQDLTSIDTETAVAVHNPALRGTESTDLIPEQRTLNPRVRHRRSHARRRSSRATGVEPRAARPSTDGCVPAQRHMEPARHPGREAGTAQVTPIFDLSPSPGPTGEVHAMSVAGTRQAHHSSPETGQAGSLSVRERTGHRPPRAAPSGPRCGPLPWTRRRSPPTCGPRRSMCRHHAEPGFPAHQTPGIDVPGKRSTARLQASPPVWLPPSGGRADCGQASGLGGPDGSGERSDVVTAVMPVGR